MNSGTEMQSADTEAATIFFGGKRPIKKVKADYSSSWEPRLRATGRHLPYGITQCYLPPDTSERAPPNPSHAGWYSMRDGRVSWPSWLDSAPAGSRISDLSITSPTPNRCTTKTTKTTRERDKRTFWEHENLVRYYAYRKKVAVKNGVS